MRNIDASNMLKHLEGLSHQLRESLDIYRQAPYGRHADEISSVAITGMGGSAMGGDLLRSLVGGELGVPMTVVRGYRLPAFVGPGTLMIGISHSGNTEETLSTFQQGLERGASAYAVTSGGKLSELAQKQGIPCARIPSGMPPRCALGYLFVPPLLALADAGLIDSQEGDIEEAAQVLSALSESYAPHNNRDDNLARRLALELQGMITVIYGSEGGTDAAAQRWKTQINENSKAFAVHNVVPEMNHNEIVGWDAQPELAARTAAIFLRDPHDHPSVARRMEINQVILGEKGLTVREFRPQGESRLARLFSFIYLGDYTSYYLALLYEIDPTPVEIIEELKRQLAK